MSKLMCLGTPQGFYCLYSVGTRVETPILVLEVRNASFRLLVWLTNVARVGPVALSIAQMIIVRLFSTACWVLLSVRTAVDQNSDSLWPCQL